MVTKVFKVVYKEIRGLHEAAYILAAFTLASQFLALFRDRLLAHQFGAGTELDLYYTAFRIPDLLFVVFASVLSVYVLIPFVTEARGEGGEAAAESLLSQVFTIFLFGYSLFALIIALFAYQLVALLFPGFTQSEYPQLVLLLRILLLQPFFLSISNLFGVVTQLSNRFVLYALSPILYNIGIIIGILLLYPRYGLAGLGLGVVLGAVLHLAVQLPLMRHIEMAPRVRLKINTRQIYRILKISVPRALTLSLHQIVLLAFVGIASAMAVGSVSIFQFALNLQSVPLAIIGVSYSEAAFPTLVRMFTSGDREQFVAHVGASLRHIFFWSIPLIALVIVTRAQIVRVILGSGAFNWNDTKLTAAALALFVLSLAAQSVNLLIVRAFYAGGDTRTPFFVTVFTSSGALLLGILLYSLYLTNAAFAAFIGQILRVESVPGGEILMLPLGYSIAVTAHAVILLTIFMKRFKLPFSAFGGVFLRGFAAALTGGVSAYAILNTVVFGINDQSFIGILLQGVIAGGFGMGMVIATLWILGSVELAEVSRAIHRRMIVRTIIPPQPSDDVAA